MARFAIIEGGVAVNIVEAESGFAAARGWVDAQGAGVGWLYDGETFTAPPAPPVPVPQSVTQRQARLMLHRQGVLAGVDAVIDAMPEPVKTEARIEWEYASAIVRTSPLVAAMGVALGLDDAGLDALFIAASEL